MKGRNRKIKERRHLYTIYRKSLCGVCHPKKKKPEKKNHISVSIKVKHSSDKEVPFEAPENFSFIENTKECSTFFNEIRKKIPDGNRLKIIIKYDLSKVSHIDFSAVVVLKAINRELFEHKITVIGNLPNDKSCKDYMVDSDFLNGMRNLAGYKYPQSPNTESIRIEQGDGKLTIQQMKAITNVLQHSVNHIDKSATLNPKMISLMKEICGNSIEWGGTSNKSWTVCAKFETDRVLFVAADLGKGILNTLSLKSFARITKNDDEILEGVFIRKYGSKSKELNRNNGLPSIKAANDDKITKKMVVITNNVKLQFESTMKSAKFANDKSTFLGTLYSWELDSDCINNK